MQEKNIRNCILTTYMINSTNEKIKQITTNEDLIEVNEMLHKIFHEQDEN